MSFSKYFSKQARKPYGLFGKLVMSRIFDQGNSLLNNFMEETLSVEENDHILEIGFGTGKLLHGLAKRINYGKLEGIDFSDTMVDIAGKKNKKFIDEGKVILKQGDFENFSYNENTFDKICSSNTIYFWQHPEIYIKKMEKILKPGAKVVLAFEDKKNLVKKPLSPEIFKIYSEDEILCLIKQNGLPKDVHIFTKKKGSQKYHCAVAFK